jgi:hypothetical protein
MQGEGPCFGESVPLRKVNVAYTQICSHPSYGN